MRGSFTSCSNCERANTPTQMVVLMTVLRALSEPEAELVVTAKYQVPGARLVMV